VVVDHGSAFVCVVVRSFHDGTAVGLNRLRGGVDIGGLDADDDVAGHRVVHRGRQREGDRPTVEGRVVGPVAKLQRHPEGLGVEPDRFIQVVG
jgi:hypothetical protein